MTSALRPDLARVQIKLDALPNLTIVIDASGSAWQKSSYLGFWYRAFDGKGISSFEAAQQIRQIVATHLVEVRS